MRSASTLPLALAFLSGYVDTAVFVHMNGLFVAHVTGNFVLLGTLVAGADVMHGSATMLQIISFPLFFVAAAAGAVIATRVGTERRTPVLLWTTATLTFVAGAAALPSIVSEGLLAMTLVVAMGLLNAAHRLDKTLGAPFTVMTGNVTSVAIGVAQMLGLAADHPGSDNVATIPPFLRLIAGFAGGCALGAIVQSFLGLAAMILPALLLALVLAAGKRMPEPSNSV
ncbi:YoaK family protein [Jiella marina]|uniref:YoaK family protein n=1 Tax=Jiella sp. LLJ827 TaxID=2917712 RepID=UPI0021017312|nr:YoaK family protein [Jiella sp. LLJ827]MCQ0988232.1 DUF1275 domain-containing protein [Jiella sp. LLJ827]